MAKDKKKTTKKDFNKKTKRGQTKTQKPYNGGGTFCSTMSRLRPRNGYVPGESW